MEEVDGKVAVVTGGASGIGYGIARALLGAGMKVAILDRSQAHLDEVKAELKGANNLHFIQVDVTDRAAMAAAADEVEQVFGKVHVVCNNAGVPSGEAIDEAAYEEWDWVLGVNLGGVINGVKSFVPKIKAQLLIHYAGLDTRINEGWPAYEAALKAAGVKYEEFIYPNLNHGFHNDTTPRYDEAAAKLAWSRTVEFFKKTLG